MIRRLVLIGLVAWGCGSGGPGPSVRVTVPRGATMASVTDTLVARGVITSPRLFRFYARITFRSHDVEAGTYDIPRGTSLERVLGILTHGIEATRRLVVPEGYMLGEVARAVASQLDIPADSLLAHARDTSLTARLGIPGTSLDGYLYPSTYHVAVGATPDDVVRQMVDEFEQQWRPAWTIRAESLRMTRHQIVTLASIIEGEVRYSPDRAYVASVYHNRLARRMRLQADPTVIYALGRRRRLYEKDYLIRSPFNTYQIDGLPPGPINQPSAASIEAALYPARTPFLYFVARSDGKHIFSRTLSEHLLAIRQVRESGRGGARQSGKGGRSQG